MGQHHDSAPSLNYTVISIDSPHMRKDGSNYLQDGLQDFKTVQVPICQKQFYFSLMQKVE